MDFFSELARTRARDLALQAAWTGAATMGPERDQLAALLQAAALLDQIRVPYMLIGGVAVGLHARRARSTLDVDFAVASSADRLELGRAFASAGFAATGSFAHSLNFRHASGEPVQLAFDPSFDAAIVRASEHDVRGQRVRLVTRDDLIELKLRASRDPARRKSKSLQDQADVELLRGDVPSDDEGW